MTPSYTIASEADAFALLEQLVAGLAIEEAQVAFSGWPRFEIRIQGRDYAGTIPTRVMPTLLELQRQIHRVYASTVYGDPSRRLTQADRERLELVVRVEAGSSVFETLLDGAFWRTLQEAVAKMSPTQVTAVLLVAGIAVTSTIGWALWLNNRYAEKQLAQTVELSRIEREKMEILAEALRRFPQAAPVAQAMDPVRDELVRRLHPGDTLGVPASDPADTQAQPVSLDADTARQITRAPRELAQERLVVDRFLLLAADFSKPGVVRVELRRMSDGYSFRADVPAGVLTNDQERALRDKSWERQELTLQVLANELRDRYTGAKVIAVKDAVATDE